jgi:hypothetical protein
LPKDGTENGLPLEGMKRSSKTLIQEAVGSNKRMLQQHKAEPSSNKRATEVIEDERRLTKNDGERLLIVVAGSEFAR